MYTTLRSTHSPLRSPSLVFPLHVGLMLRKLLQHELTLSILTPHQSPSKPAHQPNTSCCAATRATTACDDAMAPQAVPPSWCRQSIETGGNRTTVQPEGTTNKSCDAGPWPPSVGTLERVGEGSSTKSSCLSSKSSSRVPPEFLQSSSRVPPKFSSTAPTEFEKWDKLRTNDCNL